jgi:hypothetical protein
LAYVVCRHFGKPWPELTDEEKGWKASQPRVTVIENRDDLYFLADALKMASEEMARITTELHELIALIKKEQQP